MNTPFPRKPVSLGILCATGLGDAIIQMVLANNLQRNGYSVTFYSDMASQLHSYIASYQVLPFPQTHDETLKSASPNNGQYKIINQLKQHHIVLYDCRSKYFNQFNSQLVEWLKNYGVAYQMSNGEPLKTVVNIEQHLSAQLPNVPLSNIHHYSKQLYGLNRSLKNKSFSRLRLLRPPIVKQVVQSLTDVGLSNVTDGTGLQLKKI